MAAWTNPSKLQGTSKTFSSTRAFLSSSMHTAPSLTASQKRINSNASPTKCWSQRLSATFNTWRPASQRLITCSEALITEACPTSNVRTRVVHTIKNHPIKVFNDIGLTVTVNTDDPSMFGTDMNKEYLQLHHQLGFSLQQLFKFSLNAVNSSFLPEESKSKMRKSFMKTYNRILNEE